MHMYVFLYACMYVYVYIVASMRQVQVVLLELSGIFFFFFFNIFDPCIESGAFWTQRLEGVRGTPKGQLRALVDNLCWSAFLSEIGDL